MCNQQRWVWNVTTKPTNVGFRRFQYFPYCGQMENCVNINMYYMYVCMYTRYMDTLWWFSIDEEQKRKFIFRYNMEIGHNSDNMQAVNRPMPCSIQLSMRTRHNNVFLLQNNVPFKLKTPSFKIKYQWIPKIQ